MTQPGLPAR